MTQENVCLFNKFGHCKFSTKCRQFHVNEMCENKSCESQKCPKRHPRACHFFNQYQRCKFGEFCSYLHILKSSPVHLKEKDFEEVKTKLLDMEKVVSEQENELKILKQKVASLEENSLNLKVDIQKAIENAVKVTTKELVNTFIKNQDIAEKRNEAMLNSLNSQIEMLTNCLVSPKSDDFNPEQFHTQSEHHEIIPQPDHHQQHQNTCQSRYTGSQDPANAHV